ncbi:hypothetical protein PICMEDRAFT_16227 [Pichia membranifaciens NRRL Y-2026]|uniref:J domain-containing protein n=1 Tax=Pichia membranifaciens NRRL Y-2026 TaxID=763406 RepID=A0A1E3NJK8_9ASCO|nr:hypothetical protein PICMEDRAFT_16227 [Pichia membranifaciens NRRL Y-2026]ODQ46327.1 hypothetical protein PICMEDRAFT_16227 [Pichia membranifaciens NRRL Y-2026]
MRTCYYELLGVEQTATHIELKKAYRKKALLLHPDKNPDDVENTTRLFNDVRVAYETLSDPQERSWYDSHKFQILMEDGDRDSAAGYDDDGDNYSTYYAGTTVEDIEKYFSNTLYQNFNDSINGFYSIVSVLLDKIASEEVSAGKQQKLPGFQDFKDDTSFATVCDPKELMYPRMGNSKTDFEMTRIFYKVWGNFQTVKTFNWIEEYRYSTAPDRRTRRIMEKENKKLRDQGRKAYNDVVKKYISYIKKMDPRMDPVIRKKYEKQQLALKRQELKKQAQLEKEERQRQRQLFEEQEWQTVDPDDLAEIEAQLDKIHEEERKINGQEADDEDHDEEIYECIICDKIFKSEKQFADHERSKKHLKLLKQLKWEMKKEGIELGIDNDGYINDNGEEMDNDESDDEDFEDFDDALESLTELDELTNEELQYIIDQQISQQNDDNANANKSKDVADIETPDQSSKSIVDVQLDDDIDEESHVDPATADPQEWKTDKKHEELSKLLNGMGIESDDSDDWGGSKSKVRTKKGKNKSKKAGVKASDNSQDNLSVPTETEKCSVCSESFASRNKLFQQVNSTGHAASPSKVKKGKKKEKRK